MLTDDHRAGSSEEWLRYAHSDLEIARVTPYPGDLEPVDDEEYQDALRLAETVLSWAECIIQNPSENTPEEYEESEDQTGRET